MPEPDPLPLTSARRDSVPLLRPREVERRAPRGRRPSPRFAIGRRRRTRRLAVDRRQGSHPSKRSPIFVCALHLVELTGRTAALLIVNSTGPTVAAKDIPAIDRIQAQSDAIAHAFVLYEERAGGVTAQCLTAFSPYATMHEDVFAVGEDSHAAFIILPFHMHQTVDGGTEVDHPEIRGLNQAILMVAPCSIGILVGRLGLNQPAASETPPGGGFDWTLTGLARLGSGRVRAWARAGPGLGFSKNFRA